MDLFDREFEEHLAVAAASKAKLGPAFRRMLDAWVGCIRAGGKIMFFGNGGSAGDAQHLATELVVRYRQDRAPIAGLLGRDYTGRTCRHNSAAVESERKFTSGVR